MDGSEFTSRLDPIVFGHRLRYFRNQARLTLAELADRVGRQASYLSMVENGRRDPNLSLIDDLATALSLDPAELLTPEPPHHRARLEIELDRAQQDPLYQELGLSHLKPSARLPDQVLEHLLALYGELKNRSRIRATTPEAARRANAALRAEMRDRNNYFSEIERLAHQALTAVGYPGSGAVSPRLLSDLASHFGFSIHQVQDLPTSTRSITDLRHRRIYIPQRDELRTRAARSVILQTLGHFALQHRHPAGFGDFLGQRVEANYFAGAVLVPEQAAAPFLKQAKTRRDLSVEDLKELFYISYEMAAHRFTNLATHHLDIPLHFIRTDTQGVIWKAYQNDGIPFPTDPHGAIEGQRTCRQWSTRQVFGSQDQFSIHYQYTDTPAGTYWTASHVEADREPHHAVTIGTTLSHARYFRGSDTHRRIISHCPHPNCCNRPPEHLAARWDGYTWPSPRTQSHILAALPAGTFPGVDPTEIYEFLERSIQA